MQIIYRTIYTGADDTALIITADEFNIHPVSKKLFRIVYTRDLKISEIKDCTWVRVI